MEKLAPKDISGFCLIPTTPMKSTEVQHCREVEDLLTEYKDVFEEPKGLPPEGGCDHAIPLKENATPPLVRPHRVPHKQKNEMEAQIKDLLESSVI